MSNARCRHGVRSSLVDPFAVGNALGRNPIPVVVPCHRVVRIKQHLLALEGVTLA